jgi:hypothetical protein
VAGLPGYEAVRRPRGRLAASCELRRLSIFDLPPRTWQLEGSEGYDVSGIEFPSVRVTQRSLGELLARLPVTGTDVLRTDKTVRPLRPGYDGMLFVTGFAEDDTAAR